MPPMVRSLTVLSGLVFAAFLGGCERTPSVELRDWSPSDHDGEKKLPQGAKQGARGSTGGTAALGEAAWGQQCATCHGPQGRGDGPQGPMFKAPDLSRSDWQGRVSDDQIASTIRNGKGRMPKFELPDDVVRQLVQKVRSFRGP
jgi:mono/diheme cytochrome c family protein